MLDEVIYSSLWERDLTIALTILFAVVSLSGQSLILMAIILHNSLHTIHFCILANQCAGDILLTLTTTTQWLIILSSGHRNDLLFCSVISTLGISMFFTIHMLLGLFALERYFFFCNPMRYTLIFSPKKVTCIILFCYAFPFLYLSPHITQREFSSSSMICEYSPSLLRITINSVVFRLIPLAIIIFSMQRVWKLTKSNRVAPALPSTSASSATTSAPSTLPPLASQAKSAVRMVFLVSGTFWLAYFPGVIIRSLAVRLGYSMDDINSRRAFVPAILNRVAFYFYGTLSSLVNPLIYMYSRKDLRRCVFRMLRVPVSKETGENAQGHTYTISATN